MRVLKASILAMALAASQASAADSTAPLAAGKPSGVKQAQLLEGTNLWIVLGAAAFAGVLVVAATNGGNPPAAITIATTP